MAFEHWKFKNRDNTKIKFLRHQSNWNQFVLQLKLCFHDRLRSLNTINFLLVTPYVSTLMIDPRLKYKNRPYTPFPISMTTQMLQPGFTDIVHVKEAIVL